MNSKIT